MNSYIQKSDKFLYKNDIEAYELKANVLVIVLGIVSSFRNEYFENLLASRTMGNLSNFLVTNIVSGAVSGLLTFFISGALLKVCSGFLGGKASWSKNRVIIAWSSIPILTTSFITLIIYILLKTFGSLSEYMTVVELFEHPAVIFTKYLSIFGLISSVIVTSYLVSRVNKFSIFRAIACLILFICAPLFLFTPFIFINIV